MCDLNANSSRILEGQCWPVLEWDPTELGENDKCQQVPQSLSEQHSKMCRAEHFHLIAVFVWVGAGMTIAVLTYWKLKFIIIWNLFYASEKDGPLSHFVTCTALCWGDGGRRAKCGSDHAGEETSVGFCTLALFCFADDWIDLHFCLGLFCAHTALLFSGSKSLLC